MSDKHNVCADPLTAYWRAKVNRASSKVFAEMGGYGTEFERRDLEREERLSVVSQFEIRPR